LKNLISIKEARLKKGLSIAELASSLKLDVKLVQLLDDDAEVPDKYKAYMSSYKRSIFNYLGYKIHFTNHFQETPYDYSKFLLTSFFLIFSIVILFFSSFNIYNKFNNQILIRNIDKDQVYMDVLNLSSQYDLNELSHDEFINNLILSSRVNYSQKISIFSKSNKTIYYKIQNKNRKTIQFGEIFQSSELNLDLDNDFLIDLSNINNVEKIIYRGIEIKVSEGLNSYLLNFNIKDLEALL
jgi:hypothetical protein